MKKRVGLLISTLNSGGAERVVSRLSNILNDEYEVFVILFEDTYIKYDYYGKLINIDVKAINNNIISKVGLPFKRAYRLKGIKKDLKLDVVISFLDSPNIVNILSKVKKCKTIISVRNYSNKEKQLSKLTRVIDFCMRILYKKADKIIPVSEVIKDSLINDYKVDKNKIDVIYNPYDIEEINYLAEENICIEHEEFMNSEKIFISVGRQMYQKGFWHLVKAFKIVNDSIPDTKLVIVGEDFQNGLVQNLVNELGIQNSVLLTGYQKNPFKYIKRSSVYVLSSMFEGFPNSMAESLVCGCPVIAVDCKSGPREILLKKNRMDREILGFIEADYGILVEELSNIECWDRNKIDSSDIKLANAMQYLINNKKLIEVYSKKGKKRSENFNYKTCKEKFIKIIE